MSEFVVSIPIEGRINRRVTAETEEEARQLVIDSLEDDSRINGKEILMAEEEGYFCDPFYDGGLFWSPWFKRHPQEICVEEYVPSLATVCGNMLLTSLFK